MNNVKYCNIVNDGCFYDENFSSDKSFNLVENHDQNTEYSGQVDPDYITLINQCSKEGNYDEHASYIKNVNAYNNGYELYNHADKTTSKELSDKNHNPSIIGLSASDDEALEDYLSALAKNYDDIDRRIKNAERYVNQMDDSQSPISLSNTGFANPQSYTNSVDKSDKNNHKYITELKVNIAESFKTETDSNFKEIEFNNDNNRQHRFVRTSSKIPSRKHHPPLIRKRSSSYISSNIDQDRNAFKTQKGKLISNTKTEYARHNYMRSDLEQRIISPPRSFCTNYERIIKSTDDKEIQTVKLDHYTNNNFSQALVEERGVQTMSYTTIVLKETVDVGIETENPFCRETPKIRHNKSTSYHKTLSSEFSDLSPTNRSDQISKSLSNEYTENAFDKMTPKDRYLKSPIKGKVGIKKNRESVNLLKSSDSFTQWNSKNVTLESPKKRHVSDKNCETKSKMKSPSYKAKTVTECLLKNDLVHNMDDFDSKNCAKDASMEIQRLLEKLGSHLKSTMSLKAPKIKRTKARPSTESSMTSFWDNPLQKNDIINSKGMHYSNTLKLNSNPKKITKKTNNIINSEMQAIYKTIGKNMRSEKQAVTVQESSESEIEFQETNVGPIRNESLEMRQNLRNATPNQHSAMIKKSTSNLNLAGDIRISSNYKISKSFDLNPYDDIIKAHLNPIDRRVKSVASKNGCAIVIEGPISAYDPSTSHTFRNKVMYRCTISGACKDSLDKCVNYLKETFPNTFLKTNSRS